MPICVPPNEICVVIVPVMTLLSALKVPAKFNERAKALSVIVTLDPSNVDRPRTA